MGTIATVGHVDVMLKRRRLGVVEEYFIKGLKPGDVFVIGGRTVRLLDAGFQSARVEAADGERPNVPSWGTAGLALTSGLAEEIGRVREKVDALLEKAEAGETQPADVQTALDWLVEHWDLSLANAQAVIAQFQLQRRHSVVPHGSLMLIEQYREPGETGRSNYFFHCLIGRSANDALSRIVARRVAAQAGGNALVSTDDYGFLLTLQRFQELSLEQWRECFAPEDAEADLRLALKESELVRWQFRGVAQTGLMVPRQFPGRQRAVRQLRFSSEILFRVLEEHEPDHPMLEEAYRQSIDHFLNLRGALAWMEKIASPGWPWRLIETAKVSPFSFGLFASRFREGMMFEDPADAIERMYHQFYGAEAL
jgi:ATP-dependent Lhr-like helicase